MGFAASLAAGFLPMLLFAWLLYRLDRYEREPFFLLVAVFGWGALVAASGAYLINSISNLGLSLLFGSDGAASFTTTTITAPIVEETLKGFAVLLVYFLFRAEFDSRLDGILYASTAALGFAASENLWYIYQYGFLPGGWTGFQNMVFIRTILVGWQHPFYSAFFGLGLAISRSSADLTKRCIAPLVGFSAAVAFHMLHNLLAVILQSTPGLLLLSSWDWMGYLALLVYTLAVMDREQSWMTNYLEEEVTHGILPKKYFQASTSRLGQLKALKSAPNPQARRYTRKLFQRCGDLMHKKRQLNDQIADINTESNILELREEIQDLVRIIQSSN